MGQMRHRYASDSHNHSRFSPDGSNTAREMCERASELGLYYYTLTDHVECNNYSGGTSQDDNEDKRTFAEFNFKKNSANGFIEMQKLQEEFNENSGVRFLKGVELGQAMQNMDAAEDVVARDYDFVLASVHNVGGFEDFYWLDSVNQPDGFVDDLISKYFAEILEVIKWGKFNSLSHLTYPVRYISTKNGKPYSLDNHMDEIKTVLEAVIKNKKAIELNTSSLYYSGKVKETQPNQEILNLYHDMGAEYVTIGSDAHSIENLGGGIDEGMDMLKKAGFEEFTVFVKGEPVKLPLD